MPNFADAMMQLYCKRLLLRKKVLNFQASRNTWMFISPSSLHYIIIFFKSCLCYNTLKLRNHISFYSGCRRPKYNCSLEIRLSLRWIGFKTLPWLSHFLFANFGDCLNMLMQWECKTRVNMFFTSLWFLRHKGQQGKMLEKKGARSCRHVAIALWPVCRYLLLPVPHSGH